MRIILLGPQGSGKGTYASRLSPILGIPKISTGDICRENIDAKTPLGKKIEKFVNSGTLVPDEIIIKVVEERLKKPDIKKGFIFDGFPRNLEQAKALDKITSIDYVINLVVPEWILLERLSARRICKECNEIFNLKTLKPKREGVCDKCGGELIQRADETEEAIRQRLKLYKEQTAPLIKYYKERGILRDVPCNKADIPPDIVVKEILGILKVSI